LHGPHQGAQKSTRTGVLADASTTSVMKVFDVTTLAFDSDTVSPGFALCRFSDGILSDVVIGATRYKGKSARMRRRNVRLSPEANSRLAATCVIVAGSVFESKVREGIDG
jgi:hypothetical protein